MNAPLTGSWDDLSCGRNNSALEPRLAVLLVGEKLSGITTLWSCHLQGTETGSGTDSGIVGLGNGSLEHWMSALWASEAGAGEWGWAVRGTVVRLARRGVELEENLPRLNPSTRTSLPSCELTEKGNGLISWKFVDRSWGALLHMWKKCTKPFVAADGAAWGLISWSKWSHLNLSAGADDSTFDIFRYLGVRR